MHRFISAGLLAAVLSGGVLCGGLCGCRSEPPKAPEPEPEPPPVSTEQPATLSLAPSPPILMQEVGFQAPQAALHDAEQDVYLVSNVNGGPADADGNGFISRVAPDGTVLALEWIHGGLDAPKGMALSDDKLYVADLNVVKSFDRKSGEALGKVAILSARSLDDVALAPDGTLYVSDNGLGKQKGSLELGPSGSDALYSVDARGVAKLLVKGTELGQPTALLADAAGVWVASLKGALYRVSSDGKRGPSAQLPAAALRGLIELEPGRLALASAEASTVFAGTRAGEGQPPEKFDALITELSSPGDLGYDRKRRQLIVPLGRDNALYIQQVPAG